MSPAEVAGICGAILGVAAVCGLLWKVAKGAYRAARRIERIESLATELEHNSGSSIKDAVHRIEDTLSEVAGKVDNHESLIVATKEEQVAIWEAIKAVAEAEPAGSRR